MSRSYRFKRGWGQSSVTVSGFQKGIHDDKKENNRRLRRVSNHRLRNCYDFEDLVLPERLEEVMERWSYRDDGRHYINLRDIYEFWSDNPWTHLFK